ncbi:TonB-dependent receptor [Alteromonas sp. C1M14]|uniref:TonB-dependent receptor n=1 Tax=Alteromonas sp. C1M14 TaxID=2841567 RepID=UPI001C08D785|nr:TonB-dependent receptor [Alteromonas sp. C1M14]MBU2978137.1 TonB-dependent receptor [Alteromonas sp. C1M14]
MKNRNQLAVLAGLMLPCTSMAATINGEALNQNGAPLKNATIEIESLNVTVTADKNGKFTLPGLEQGEYILHIVSPGYAHLHQTVQINDDGTVPVSFYLKRSPIEVIDIVASPMHMSIMESAAPVSVLGGETLRRQQAATLGDTLEKQPGVQSNFHGNVASTPIIRGLSGPRVLIAQNGLDVSDVSRVGPDHSVASEASTSQQIEVLRGPATLFYGSGAIGGVVNVVDGRVPTSSETRGEWLLETDSVNNQKLGAFNLTTGTDNIGFYADGYWRESDDYDTPVAPDIDDPDGAHTVANSAEESHGFTLGTSYLFEEGYIGVAVEQFDREYGIPGHSHGDEGDLDEDEQVYADLEQTKVQLLGEYNIDSEWLRKIQFKAGYTDYEHAEIELGAVGTLFENTTNEVRVELMHNKIADWNGGISLHYKNAEISAQGEEAFTPPSETELLALGLMEERHFGDFLVQLGARIERVTLDAPNVLLPQLSAHSHEEEEDEDDHDHEEETSLTRVFAVDQTFTPVSLSAGIVWDFTPGYNVALSVSRSQRAPSASELLSFGPHIGTGSYEIGALFALSDDHDSALALSQQPIDLETANNIDISFRKTSGDIGFVFNLFYNEVDNYYYQTNTGLFAESGHDHDHEETEVETDEHTDELPVYLFEADDAILHGFEAQVAWQVTDAFKAQVFSDYVRARLKNGGELPRTPPLRFGTQLSYETETYSAHLDITHYSEQDRIADYETTTDSYTLVDAVVTYDMTVLQQDMSLYLKGTNLTDTEARVHTSFLKDLAPRPGRSIGIGLRGYF